MSVYFELEHHFFKLQGAALLVGNLDTISAISNFDGACALLEYTIRDLTDRMDFDNNTKEDWQVMTSAARKLKTIAQENKLVIIMVAQLNASGRLAQASYMSHEADLWLNLKKPEEKELNKAISQRGQLPWWNMFLEIKKARNAKLGKVPVYFDGDKLRFIDSEMEKIKEGA